MTEPRPDRSPRRTAGERIVRAAPRRRSQSATPPPEHAGLGDVLRNTPFLLLWLAQVSTQVGGNMVLYGLTVIASGYSNTAVAGLFLSYLVPAVIFSAVAGVYVDQVDRRHMLIVTNVLRGIAYLAIFLVGNNLLLMYPLVIFVATVTTFFGPAEASMIPTLVPRAQLVTANGLFTLTMNVAFAAGFALLGPIVTKIFGPAILLLVVAALYFVAAGFCWTLPPAPTAEPAAVTPSGAFNDAERAVETMLADLREGIDYIRKNPTVGWALSYQAITASLIGVVGTLGPDFANTALGLSKQDFFVVVLPLGVGLAFGILLLNSYGRFMPRRRVIEGGLIGLGVMLGFLSVAGPIARFLQGQANKNGLTDVGGLLSLLSIVIVLGFLAGIAYAFVAISSQTQLQEDTHEDVRGRIFGVLQMLVSIASFVPIIIVAPIADLIGVPTVLLVVALLVALSGAYSVIRRGPMAPEEASVRAPSEPIGAPVDMVTVAIGGGEFRTTPASERPAGFSRASAGTSTTSAAAATSVSVEGDPAAASATTATSTAGGEAMPAQPVQVPAEQPAAAVAEPAVAELREAAEPPQLIEPAPAEPAPAEPAPAGPELGEPEHAEADRTAERPRPANEYVPLTAPAERDPSLADGRPHEPAAIAPADAAPADAALAAPASLGAEVGAKPSPSQPREGAQPGEAPQAKKRHVKRGVIRRSPLDPEPGTSLGDRLRRAGNALFRRNDGEGET